LMIAAGLFLGLAVLLAPAVAADEAVKSGPQVGEEVPGPFHPLNVTGESAGKKACLYCKNGSNPVAMIFAREVSEPLNTLIKKVDKATAQHKEDRLGSFVVFLNDSEDLAKQLKDLAEKDKIEHTVLSIDNAAGPERYNVSKDADVTVVLYTKHNVKANYAFPKGKMTEKDVDKIVADLSKILPKE